MVNQYSCRWHEKARTYTRVKHGEKAIQRGEGEMKEGKTKHIPLRNVFTISKAHRIDCYIGRQDSLLPAAVRTHQEPPTKPSLYISWENWAKVGSQKRGTCPSSSWQQSGSGVYIGLEPWRMYWVEWNTLNASPARKSREESRPVQKCRQYCAVCVFLSATYQPRVLAGTQYTSLKI